MSGSRGLRLFGHPLHAILSDFPLALLCPALMWDVIALMRGEALWWAIGFWTMVLGVAIAVPTALAGLVDYAALPEGSPALKTAVRHMLVMGLAVSIYLVSVIVRGGPAAPQNGRLIVVLALEGAGALLLGLGGWFGGHLVFRHGVGRQSEEH